MMKQKYNVYGMTCSACSSHVDKSVRKLEGVFEVNVQLLQNSMVVEYDETKVTTTDIINAVSSSGYQAEVVGNQKKEEISSNHKVEENHQSMKRKVIVSFGILLPLMYITMGHMVNLPEISFLAGTKNAVAFALTQMLLTLIIMYNNRHYFTNGFKALWNKAPTMDSLIALGSSAAFLYSVYATYQIGYGVGHMNHAIVHKYMHDLYFESAATILTLISFGKYLEARSKGKTTDAIARLIKLAPETAIVLKDNQEVEVAIEDIQVDDIILIKPGNQIPVDGILISGESYIDESALTGESIPVKKEIGDNIISATLNKQGSFTYKATLVGEDTTLSKIIQLVEEASSSKAPIAKLADKVSAVFVPVVICIAILTAIVWLLLGQTFSFALSNGIAVLVISCPCALGLATPTAIMVGTGKAAEYGILIKSAESLEIAHSIDTVVFDKTGTITEGKMSVSDIILLTTNIDETTFLRYAASIEALSEHPLAQAIVEKAKNENCEIYQVEEFEAVAGLGVKAILAGKPLLAGNKKMLNEHGINTLLFDAKANQLASNGKTPIYFSYDNEVIGFIAVADQIKETSKQAINQLKELGINVMMLTGDHQKNAEAIQKEVKIDQVYAEILPQDKERIVRQLVESGHTVAMVGDGINDAPALVSASVGIAIGAGSDIALESSDIVLMKNDLLDVVTAIQLSDSVIRNIKQNLFWAFFYNTLGIPLAAGLFYPLFGWRLDPMFGAAAMSFSSVSVVSNALRLRFFKPKLSNIRAIHKKEIRNNKKDEEKSMKKTIVIEGMMCQNCVKHVQKAIDSVKGVSGTVHLDSNSATLTYQDQSVISLVKEAIKEAGYQVIGEK